MFRFSCTTFKTKREMKRYSILQVLGMFLVPCSLFLASCDDDNDEPDAELPAAYVAPNGT